LCIRCHGNVFTESLPRNERLFRLPGVMSQYDRTGRNVTAGLVVVTRTFHIRLEF
jgi:hypothetical protein